MSEVYEGGCLCSAVRYRATGQPLRTLVCHCHFCQKLTGSSCYAESMFSIDAVELTGELRVYDHRSESSGKAVHVQFCPKCGTTVTLTFQRWPEYRAISRGTFDSPNLVSIGSHIWTESAQTGMILPEGIDCFRQARATLEGTLIEPTRYPHPVAAASDA